MGGLLSVNVHQLDIKSMNDRDRWAVINEELVKHPKRANEKNKGGETPLHRCATMGSGIERMIDLFVSHGGDCNIPNSDGLTVLHINCSCGGGLIDLFVKHGASVNALDNQGQPPVMYALIYRSVPVFEKMWKLGADVSIKSKEGISFLEGLDMLSESDAEFKNKVKEIMSGNPR